MYNVPVKAKREHLKNRWYVNLACLNIILLA
jgi:hypothetical protein